MIMADEFKGIRSNILKAVMSTLKDSSISVKGGLTDDDFDDIDDHDRQGLLDAKVVRELLATVLSRAGKSKDELVNIIAREIGMSVAAAIKEPLKMLAENKRLQISLEFVDKHPKKPEADKKTTKKSTATKKKNCS